MKEPPTNSRRQAAPAALLGFLLAVLVLADYWPVRHHDFIYYDDPEFVTENAPVQAGLSWATVQYAFSHAVGGNWHPLTVLSHALDCQLFGLNAGAHHLVNVAIHALNAILLFWLLLLLTSELGRSALVAGLFALHPLRVESVAWVAERKDLLCALFFFVSILLYVRYARFQTGEEPARPGNSVQGTAGKRLLFYAASLLAFAFGLMSKPMAVTLPFILLLLDYWPLRRFSFKGPLKGLKELGWLATEKVPFFALSLATCLVTLAVQKNAGATQVVARSTVWERLGNAVTSYLRYLGKGIWPANLGVIYPHPARHYPLSDQWPVWQIIAAAVVLLLISGLAVLWISRKPYIAVGWFWYLGMLIPVIGLVQAGEQAMADRYTYLPMIGLTIVVVWWAGEALERPLSGNVARVAGPVAALVLAAFFVVTRHQLSYWQNTLSLFGHAAEVTADNPSAQFGIGMGLLEQGQVRPAMVRLRVAVAIDPTYARAHYIMGQLLRMQGHLKASAEQYQAVLRCNPSDVRALVNYAGVLPQLGRPRDAIDSLNQALQLDPDSVEALNNLAWILATSPEPILRNGPKAVQLGGRACELTQFKQAPLIGTLAAAYAESGEFTKAVATAQRAIEVANRTGESALATRTQQLLELYRAGKAYREKPAL